MRKLTIFVASALLAGPAMAQSEQAPPDHSMAPAANPQMCEMMHNGEKMQGKMAKGEDGTMTCRMMDHSHGDHSQMHHGTMEHGKMDHSQMNHGTVDHGTATDDQTAPSPPVDKPASHDAHAEHNPK